MTATVVILNGVGSVGKSSICRALQKITRDPFFHVQMDDFWAMMPDRFFGHVDGATFVSEDQDGHPTVEIQTGPVAETLLSGMRASVAAMAAEGCNLLVDEVLFGNVATEHGNPVQEYRDRLKRFQTYWVGVHAPLDIIEDRERSRGDRQIGLARWQYGRIHRAMAYDFEVDVGNMRAEETALKIKGRFDL